MATRHQHIETHEVACHGTINIQLSGAAERTYTFHILHVRDRHATLTQRLRLPPFHAIKAEGPQLAQVAPAATVATKR